MNLNNWGLTLLSFLTWDWRRKKRWQKTIAVAMVTWGLYSWYSPHISDERNIMILSLSRNNKVKGHIYKDERKTLTKISTSGYEEALLALRLKHWYESRIQTGQIHIMKSCLIRNLYERQVLHYDFGTIFPLFKLGPSKVL